MKLSLHQGNTDELYKNILNLIADQSIVDK